MTNIILNDCASTVASVGYMLGPGEAQVPSFTVCLYVVSWPLATHDAAMSNFQLCGYVCLTGSTASRSPWLQIYIATCDASVSSPLVSHGLVAVLVIYSPGNYSTSYT